MHMAGREQGFLFREQQVMIAVIIIQNPPHDSSPSQLLASVAAVECPKIEEQVAAERENLANTTAEDTAHQTIHPAAMHQLM